ncbi:hypothetical protein O6H91_Y132700 [Diphasiastrum complanatum]|nr:hypothetical protein O6H91_Y132700 [Diphasiastrum complanatum]
MAGKRKAEGIALLSVYNDDEEDMDIDDEDDDEDEDKDDAKAEAAVAQEEEQLPAVVSPVPSLPSPALVSPSVPEQEAAAASVPATSPLLQVVDVVTTAAVSVGLGIVDYAHDDGNMSPEPEEGEITITGRAIVVSEATVDINVSYKEVHQPDSSLHTSSDKALSPEHAGQREESTFGNVAEVTNEKPSQESSHEENGSIALEAKTIDPLLEFLPSAPSITCSEELQIRFTKYLQMKNQGRSFNKDLRCSKGYRNPDFLQRAVRYQGIDQIGSCFKKEIFDPHGYDATDFYDALAVQQRRELEKKEQERKQSQRVDFVRGGVQPSQVAAADARTKPTAQIVASHKSGLSSNTSNTVHSTSSNDASGKVDIRVSKKSKWDKVKCLQLWIALPMRSMNSYIRPSLSQLEPCAPPQCHKSHPSQPPI